MTDETTLRAATRQAIDRFCEAQGFPVPPLDEHDEGHVVRFVGEAPDGRKFHIGYERPHHVYAPGDVRPDGTIMLAKGQFSGPIGRGTVWVTHAQADAAERHGWRRNGIEASDGGIVQVVR